MLECLERERRRERERGGEGGREREGGREGERERGFSVILLLGASVSKSSPCSDASCVHVATLLMFQAKFPAIYVEFCLAQ